MVEKRKILQVSVVVLFLGVVLAVQLMFRSSVARQEARWARMLEEIPPGTSYSEVKRQLGEPHYNLTAPHEIAEWGVPDDPSLIRECNLHIFRFRHKPPYSYTLVYEDKKTHRVRFMTIKRKPGW
ncbi:MAG: hypothetical protein ACYTEQ_19420 [Planctomycetota bacterium]|jgi:hypothetical protein